MSTIETGEAKEDTLDSKNGRSNDLVDMYFDLKIFTEIDIENRSIMPSFEIYDKKKKMITIFCDPR